MDKPTYAELEAENARLKTEYHHLEVCYDNVWKQALLWREHNKRLVDTNFTQAGNIHRLWKINAAAAKQTEEARRWARQKRQEAEQWKRWYLEVKANVMVAKDGSKHPNWLPSDDPDWIPF